LFLPRSESRFVLLEVQDLQYSYRDRLAVRGVTFGIRPGEVFGLLGPNGAGKTTTISCISGHLSGFQGNLFLRGKPFRPAQVAADRGLIGLVPQELAIYETLTASENITLFSKLAGLSATERKDNLHQLIAFAGLDGRQHELVRQFSGGMKRRLNLVCGLVHRPPLVLMDEPTVGVDPQSRNHLFESIQQLRSRGLSILYTTHYMEEAERLCDRIAIMNEGQIMAMGTANELKAMIQSPLATLEEVFLQLTGRSLRDE
jgi:ABC-2 type transport system ATP-binding protein